MTNEGEFPKINGDILYASEVNRFNNLLFPEVSGTIGYSGTEIVYSDIGSQLNYGSPVIISKAKTSAIQNIYHAYTNNGFSITASGWSGTGFITGSLSRAYDGDLTTGTGSAWNLTGSSNPGSVWVQLDFGSSKSVKALYSSFAYGGMRVGGGTWLPGGNTKIINFLGSSMRYLRVEQYGSGTEFMYLIFKHSTDGVSFTEAGSLYQSTGADNLISTRLDIIDIIPFFSGTSNTLISNTPNTTTITNCGSFFLIGASGTSNNNLNWYAYNS